MVPPHQSLVYYCCHLLAILVASDPLLQVSTTVSSLPVTDVVPDPISFSFSLLWLRCLPNALPMNVPKVMSITAVTESPLEAHLCHLCFDSLL